MTLLSTAQEILRETKNATIPSSIIGNNQDSAKQVLEAMTVSITALSRAHDWQELLKEHTFSSVASTAGYALPSDFDRFVNNTFWNTTEQWQIIGPMTSEEWRILQNSTTSGAAVGEYFRIRDKEIKIFATPTAIESYIYEYISDLIVESSVGTGQTTWLADSDVPAIDEYLLRLDSTWRLLEMQGRPYAEKQRELDSALVERVSRNGARRTINHSPSLFAFDRSRIGYPAVITP